MKFNAAELGLGSMNGRLENHPNPGYFSLAHPELERRQWLEQLQPTLVGMLSN
jgi:hypothetical protein